VSRHIYLRAYMAGVTVPSALMLLILLAFCVVRFGFQFPLPIERALVFPMALVPNLWGLWNMLYVPVNRRARIPIGLYGAVVPLFVGPLAYFSARAFGFEIPPFVMAVLPFALVIAAMAYYLVWKYLVGFFNELLEIG